ncbi:MAG TPA: peptide ABC transporter ATP-binding protein, partial [Clostridiaceae bacterium]|nr:peptide ABC transporter ATP-binding protein [Clostridiaceae bacterium]
GQQQRVAIARALAAKPSIVYADEPTGSLDSKTGEDILQVLQNMADEFKQTMVIVTHDPRVASKCRRII